MKPTSLSTSIQIVNLLYSGHSLCQVAVITGSSKSTISRIKLKLQINQENHSGGRPHLISSPTRCHLIRKLKAGEVNTVPEATKMLTNQLFVNCSNSTT